MFSDVLFISGMSPGVHWGTQSQFGCAKIQEIQQCLQWVAIHQSWLWNLVAFLKLGKFLVNKVCGPHHSTCFELKDVVSVQYYNVLHMYYIFIGNKLKVTMGDSLEVHDLRSIRDSLPEVDEMIFRFWGWLPEIPLSNPWDFGKPLKWSQLYPIAFLISKGWSLHGLPRSTSISWSGFGVPVVVNALHSTCLYKESSRHPYPIQSSPSICLYLESTVII